MAAVAFAWESQSTRRVGCSEAAKQAAKLTAVVVLPTPPFWFAQAMILAKCFPTRNLTNVLRTCKLFHVERPPGRQFIRIRRAVRMVCLASRFVLNQMSVSRLLTDSIFQNCCST